MSYIRVSMVAPPPERMADVRRRYEEIVAYVATFPGYISGWVVAPGHGEEQVGRLTIWQSEADANHAATDAHAIALHSQVQFTAGGTVWDRSFDTAPEEHLDSEAAVRAAEALYMDGGS